MSAWLYAALRGGIQFLWAGLLTLPALAGVRAMLPAELPEPVMVAVIGFVTGVVGGIAVGAIRWLETRTGYGLGARIARFAAKVIMLAVSKYQPTYARADALTTSRSVIVETGLGDTIARRALPE